MCIRDRSLIYWNVTNEYKFRSRGLNLNHIPTLWGMCPLRQALTVDKGVIHAIEPPVHHDILLPRPHQHMPIHQRPILPKKPFLPRMPPLAPLKQSAIDHQLVRAVLRGCIPAAQHELLLAGLGGFLDLRSSERHLGLVRPCLLYTSPSPRDS
eukprot:TRINITY_DN54910_c0_g1_i1.p1 TRINITY_DN54910_c0_g1~~TRINITY_DN54910_c0_g1_i1.p1  ORF type:complete len:153 (-),score=6.70 TRINITY_DN54910_c0_g1_i1:58-516(-)